jgi:8-oxo-dGTP pyrophosphatase MutT (NUDIX family)
MKTESYQAAGGVVVHDGKMLLLDRPKRGEVRLPKGHVEPGESARGAALRETREETGYADLEIVADLGIQSSQFVNPYKDREVTREEVYFLMRLRSDRRATRDETDEEQFRVVWAPLDEAPARLTFKTEQEFARRAIRAWTQMPQGVGG